MINVKIFFGAEKSVLFSLSRIFFIFIFIFFTSGVLVQASAVSNVTFTWRANPPEDYVIGYRLYYGAYSRFNSSGTPKSNFSYDYYIDLSDFKRCKDLGGEFCEMLRPDELQCESLFEDTPRCTIYNLHGDLYFAMTAYNAQNESGFTRELNLRVNPEGMAAVQQLVTTLLLKKK